MRADKNLNGKVKRIEEVLVAVFDAFAFLLGHEIEVDGLTSDYSTERTIFHNDDTVTELGDKKSGLGGERVLGNVRGGVL